MSLKLAIDGRKTKGVMAFPLLVVLFSTAIFSAAGCTASTRGIAVLQEEAPAEEPPKPIINPLTGEEVASEELISRRPLAVKIENDPNARPQSGLVDAELVFEELVEGGVTRFICIFLAKESNVLGPNRSVRPSDIDICFFLEPLLTCSGGAPPVMAMVRASGMMYLEEDGTHFWRDRTRRAPHNLYTSTARLRNYLAQKGDGFHKVLNSGLCFYSQKEIAEILEKEAETQASGSETQPQEPQGEEGTEEGAQNGLSFQRAVPASNINIGYEAACAAFYRYDPNLGVYLRWTQNKPLTDRESGRQVGPRNVIIQYVQLTSSGLRDVRGAESPNSQVIGSGKCLIFTWGKVIQGTWSKESRTAPTIFRDVMGNQIKLYPGQTWIHLVPQNIKVTYE